MPYVKLENGSIVKSAGTPSTGEKNAAAEILKNEKQDWLAKKAEFLALAQNAADKADALQAEIDELKGVV